MRLFIHLFIKTPQEPPWGTLHDDSLISMTEKKQLYISLQDNKKKKQSNVSLVAYRRNDRVTNDGNTGD